MSSFAIGMNKKIPFIIGQFETIEQADAAGAASDAEDYTACSAAKLGDTFTLTELAHIFNNLPGEEKVERFSDKQSAVRRLLAKFEANKDDIPAASPRKPKKSAAKEKSATKKAKDGRPRGKIIHMASIAGRYGGGPMAPFLAPYRASKAAVISLTHTGAHTLAPDITVNAVCPGLVATDMWKRMDRDMARIENGQEGEAFARRVNAVPMGRAQTPGDVAGVVLFLASQAADYMTGQALNVDGGLVLN